MNTLDRWGRKPDLRGLYPDLTEDEALMLRAMHEGDQSYVQHLDRDAISRAAQSLGEKWHVNVDALDPETAEWVRIQSAPYGDE